MTSHASPTPALPAHLKIGIVLFPNAFPLDFIGPLDILNTLLPSKNTADPLGVSITPVLLSHSLDPLPTSGGWSIVPHMTFTQAIEGETRGAWDGILVPGGQGARPWAEENIPAQEFIKTIVDQCKVVMTVCTGSWLLAHTGALNGQKATTNKSAFKRCVEHTADKPITWIPRARYVVSNRFWTASGVSAGIDMTDAFLKYFINLHVPGEQGVKLSKRLLGVLEVIANDEEDDPWAEYYGLV